VSDSIRSRRAGAALFLQLFATKSLLAEPTAHAPPSPPSTERTSDTAMYLEGGGPYIRFPVIPLPYLALGAAFE